MYELDLVCPNRSTTQSEAQCNRHHDSGEIKCLEPLVQDDFCARRFRRLVTRFDCAGERTAGSACVGPDPVYPEAAEATVVHHRESSVELQEKRPRPLLRVHPLQNRTAQMSDPGLALVSVPRVPRADPREGWLRRVLGQSSARQSCRHACGAVPRAMSRQMAWPGWPHEATQLCLTSYVPAATNPLAATNRNPTSSTIPITPGFIGRLPTRSDRASRKPKAKPAATAVAAPI